PTESAIRAMGSKTEARLLMEQAGVPIVPGFHEPSADEAAVIEAARSMGTPLLVKASAGGGGKGMRVVRDLADLPGALVSARREAEKAFGDGALFLERLVENARHIEVQVLGDAHGNLVHLYERECSIQRRHQKVIEEAPSPAVDGELRARLCAAAIAAARAIDYRSAGTVEMLLTPDGEFYFLEMNTRLQVEHPVTEMVTGLDLVRLQLLVAEGAPLPITQEQVALSGHALECRIYAESPAEDFFPQTGRLARWREPSGEGVRTDSGVETGTSVTIHYDPMLAKLITHGADRREAMRRMQRALGELCAHGVTTNRAYLQRVIAHPSFVAGALSTAFLEQHGIPGELPEGTARDDRDRQAALFALAALIERRLGARPLASEVPAGYRNSLFCGQRETFVTGQGRELLVEYTAAAGGRFSADVLGGRHQVCAVKTFEAAAPGALTLEIDRVRRRAFITQGALDTFYVQSPLGEVRLTVKERLPLPEASSAGDAGLLAALPGQVLKVHCAVGDAVEEGSPLVTIESMKMETEVRSPRAGVVEDVRVEEGALIEAGTQLVVLAS
ncbi:MAG: acetyl/propionyl/methylcrotonyl-CoA carboxylase subunit alpha, partial [Planctomycetota bacterium]